MKASDPTKALHRLRRRIHTRKRCLLAVLVLTSLAPLALVSLNEITPSLKIIKLLAKVGSLTGTVLLVWQMVLGFRGLAARAVSDLLWVLALHKQLGKYGALLILLHPVFITVYYVEKFDINLFDAGVGSQLGVFVIVGVVALSLLAAIVLTSLLMRRLGYRLWYCVHVTSYLMVPVVIVHSLAIGSTVRGTALHPYWWGLGVVVGLLLVFRVAAWMGWGSRRFRVSGVRRVADETTEITLEPCGPRDRIVPHVGQFAYVRPPWLHYARPFTLSHYDPESGAVTITVKALGTSSRRLQETRVGDAFRLDGPYGVFGQEARLAGRRVVLVAGGIGITPFLRMADCLRHEVPGRPVLFYGGASRSAMAYLDELAALEGLRLVPLPADESGPTGERQDMITVDLLATYLDDAPRECEWLICGPPAMVKAIERDLAAKGVPGTQIHHELFGH